jgi:hypothetical protein
LLAIRTNLNAQTVPPVRIKALDIGGVVASAQGPEAGVWVIAATTDLPAATKLTAAPDARAAPDYPANY